MKTTQVLILSAILLVAPVLLAWDTLPYTEVPPVGVSLTEDEALSDIDVTAYKETIEQLGAHINLSALTYGLKGLNKYGNIKKDRLIIIDFSLPSTQERFFLIDPQTGKILYKKYVAHGQNSGELYAQHFSNKKGSHMSSLGFYKTAETYSGKHGYSLRLDGLQRGLNHAARSRAVVIHQADYVSRTFMQQNGYLGRSWGCPALPSEDYEDVIAEIKEGTLMLIYHPSLAQDSRFI